MAVGVTVQLDAVFPAQVPPPQAKEVAVGEHMALSVEVRPEGTLEGLADSVQTGAVDGMPAPVTGTARGLPTALVVTMMEAARVSTAWGVNVTLSVQLAEAASVAPQLWVTPNMLPMVLPIAVIDKAALPELVRVMLRPELVDPTSWLENINQVGFNVTAGAAGATPVCTFGERVA